MRPWLLSGSRDSPPAWVVGGGSGEGLSCTRPPSRLELKEALGEPLTASVGCLPAWGPPGPWASGPRCYTRSCPCMSRCSLSGSLGATVWSASLSLIPRQGPPQPKPTFWLTNGRDPHCQPFPRPQAETSITVVALRTVRTVRTQDWGRR